MHDLKLIRLFVALVLLGYMLYQWLSRFFRVLYTPVVNAVRWVDYSDFLVELEKDKLLAVTINATRLHLSVFPRHGGPYQVLLPALDATLLTRLNSSKVRIKTIDNSPVTFVFTRLYWIIATYFGFQLLHMVVVLLVTRVGSPEFGATLISGNPHHVVQENVAVTFKDVAGCEEEKRELFELVEYLRDPERFRALGARVPRGVLMVGPPGTGKTLLAKAVAGEAAATFITVSGSEFVEMFVGVGASRVRELFAEAKRHSPCIIFIDELDAVGRRRADFSAGGGHQESDQTLNQLLVEMDGFQSHAEVIVIAATNRPEILDPALLRPGRFDRTVSVALPNLADREGILRIHTRSLPLAKDVDLSIIARGTSGLSGAELSNLVNEGALFAARAHRSVVAMVHFEQAREKLLIGLARPSHIMSEAERARTAYHEAGHTIVSKLLPDLDPIYKVTIIPRHFSGMTALGLTASLPETDRFYQDQQYFEHRLSMGYGGRIAEELMYGHGHVSAGAHNDIEQVTALARWMVVELGFSKDLGPVRYSDPQNSWRGQRISAETAVAIDAEVKALLARCYQKAYQLLSENVDILQAMKEGLMEHETLDAQQIDQIMARQRLSPAKGSASA